MRSVYLANDVPAWLDIKAAESLQEGRETFRSLKLGVEALLQEDGDLHVFLWKGSQMTAVFGAAFAMAGYAAELHDFGITLSKTTKQQAVSVLGKLSAMESISPDDVASFVENVRIGKFAEFAPEALLRTRWARQNGPFVDKIPEIARQTLTR
jgi:ATP-dependent Lhr-like helicase